MSYKIKYTIPFKTISNKDCLIKVEVKDYLGEQMELTAGGDPIKIETDTADLLSPIRSSLATISVYGSDYLQDLYASDPQGIKITLLIDGAVYWLGYATPDTFSQNFSSPEFIYELEAVAALSTLKYKNFDLTADFVSFSEIINKAIEYSGYSGYYLTNSITADTESFYSLRIASANFFDELGEAMTYYEVLEEIAKYAGCCFTPYGDKLYFLDYRAIKEGYNSYITEQGTAVISDLKDVREYKGTGTKLSRIAGKNKATVNCSLYELDDLLPIFDDESAIFVKMEETPGSYGSGEQVVNNKEIRRYYKQSKFDMYKYTYDINTQKITQITNNTALGIDDIGSEFVRTTEYDINKVPSKLSFDNELHVIRYMNVKTQPNRRLTKANPILSIKSDGKILVHNNVYFCISLSVKICQADYALKTNYTEIVKAPSDTVLYVYVSLRVGNMYFNGTTWTTTSAKFALPITLKKGSQMNEVYLDIDNNNTFDKGLGDLSGYTFKAPDNIVSGECEFILYDFEDSNKVDPFDTLTLNQYNRFRNIEIAYGIPSVEAIYDDWSEGGKSDVLYENIIEGNYIDEAEEISLKICTNVDGKLTLSSVLKGNAFLDTLKSDVYGIDKAENLLLDRVIDIFKTPRLVIDPTLNNNLKPYSVMTEPNLNKVFMVAGGEEDVKMESCTYNLIEI